MTARVATLCAVFLAGCSGEADQHDFVDLGIAVENDVGHYGVVTCEPLPVLAGSHRYTEHVIDEKFSITVFTSPEDVRVSFKQGARSVAEGVVISREELAAEFDQAVELILLDGSFYTVTLTSECAP
jgi:hypothetical protein